MEQKELNLILENHKKWLKGNDGERANLSGADLNDADLRDADLRYANLSDTDLRYANLSNANLRHADLRCADLSGADLNDADLRDADLRYANLSDTDLRYANLSNANLRHADLRCADLSGADLEFADLRGADLEFADLRGAILRRADLKGVRLNITDLRYAQLRGAKNVPFIPYACPDTGSFIGYKKANGYIVELEILQDARRCSATGRKCRCDKAKVLSIQYLDGNIAIIDSVSSEYDSNFIYTVGEIVEEPNYNEDRWDECSEGIHFFINRQEAVDY